MLYWEEEEGGKKRKVRNEMVYLALEQWLITAWSETSQHLVAAGPRDPRLAAASPAVSAGDAQGGSARCREEPCLLPSSLLLSPAGPQPPYTSLSLPGFTGLTPDMVETVGYWGSSLASGSTRSRVDPRTAWRGEGGRGDLPGSQEWKKRGAVTGPTQAPRLL